MINSFDDVKFEAASVLAELYEQLKQVTLSKPILRKAIELSQHNVYWHCRLIFQLAVSDVTFLFTLLLYFYSVANSCNRKRLPTSKQFIRCWS